MRQQILTYFQDSGSHLMRIAAEAQKLSGDECKHAVARVKMPNSWKKNVKRVVPLVLGILSMQVILLIEAVMPQVKHNCRVKKLFEARRAAANGFWQKVLPDGQVR